MNQYQKISNLFRQLADAFDALGGDDSGNSQQEDNSEITISGKVTKAAECRAFNKRDGSVGHMTKINVKMSERVNGSFFANCIAWTGKPEYQFYAGDEVEFVGHYEKNNRGYWDFMIADKGNLKPKVYASADTDKTPPEDDDVPF